MSSARFDDSNKTYPDHVWDTVAKQWLPKTSLDVSDATQPNGKAPNARKSGASSASKAKRFELAPFSEIRLDNTPPYLVKGLIPRTGLTVIWGPPKCGKSFWTFDLMMHVALGWGYRGRRVRQGHVVYCALEGAEGFRARIEAFRQAKMAEGVADVPFFLIATPIALAADHGFLVAAIRATLGTTPLAVVVIDTLNRSIAGSESDDRDMAAYIQAADAIRDTFKCAVIVVHHCGIDATRPRGHTSLTGAADAQIAVKSDAADDIIVAVEYMKDGPASEEIISWLEPIEVGTDADGDPITSCVVVPVESSAHSAKKARASKLTKGAKIALAALQEAIDELGEVPPASNHIPPSIKAVKVAQWRDYAYRRGISTSDKPDASRVAFARAAEHLVAARQVTIWSEYVWVV
jgi:AAA domain